LKKCFESRDVQLLQKTLTTMSVEDAKYHMKRCVDSGLWVPNAADAEAGVEVEGSQDESVFEDAESEPQDDEASTQKVEKDKEPVATKTEPIYTGVSTNDLD